MKRCTIFFRNIRQKLNYIFKFNEKKLEKDHTWTTPQKRMLNVILEIIHGRLIKCLSIQFVEKRRCISQKKKK